MSVFDSYWSFIRFDSSVRHSSRYVQSRKSREFLETLVATATSRHWSIDAGENLWRACIGHDIKERSVGDVTVEDSIPFSAKRMKPLTHSAHEGRINPKGIPCLYLASDKETSMAEVRPGVGTVISLGRFQTRRQLTLVDFSKEDKSVLGFYETEPEPKLREAIVWAMVGTFFSRPVTNAPETAEYVSTQIIAETLRHKGFDGVQYRSSLGPGRNVALFDLDAAELQECTLYEARSVEYSFEVHRS